jgi:hypothetical protein
MRAGPLFHVTEQQVTEVALALSRAHYVHPNKWAIASSPEI